MKHTIYIHKNKINGKYYVGQTVNPKKRFGKDGSAYMGCKLFYRAIKLYGWNSFEHRIVQEGLTKRQADELETDLIYWLDSKNNGYNLTYGGGGRTKYKTDEERKAAQKELQKRYRRRKYEASEAFKIREDKKYHRKQQKRLQEQKKPIYCIEDKLLFNTVDEAAEYYGVTKEAIRNKFTLAAYKSKRVKHFIHWYMNEFEQVFFKTTNPLEIML